MRAEVVIFTGNTLYLGLNGELKTKEQWLVWGRNNNVNLKFQGGPDD